MAKYSVEVIETSREFTKKEQLGITDLSNAVRLDVATASDPTTPIRIHPVAYAKLQIHNEKSEREPDYINYIIIDDAGQKYVTGSESFWNAFENIAEHMQGEDFEIDVYRKDSKNYAGKQFITCSVVMD